MQPLVIEETVFVFWIKSKVKYVSLYKILKKMRAKREFRHQVSTSKRNFSENREITYFSEGDRDTHGGGLRTPSTGAKQHCRTVIFVCNTGVQPADQPGNIMLFREGQMNIFFGLNIDDPFDVL